MAHRVCISQSESFLEISSLEIPTGVHHSRRYYLPKSTLDKSLSDFWSLAQIESVDQVVLALKTSRTILKKRLGNSPVFIVTEGFENWLDMNLPLKTKSFTLNPSRVPSMLNSDWVFGVKERTSPAGEIETPVDSDELEFLASKLEMSRVKNIALGLLHSDKNPKNEELIRQFFSDRGFQIFTSHQWTTCHNERHRWLTPIIDAYLAPSVQDQISTYLKSAPLIESSTKVKLACGDGITEPTAPSIFSTLVGDVFLLQKSAPAGASEIFYFGLEDFFRIQSQGAQSTLQTEHGLAALTCPHFKTLGLSPTHVLRPDFWGVGEWVDSAMGYEPGPMCVGRGLQPTFLDLLFLHTSLDAVSPLNQMLLPQNKSRILEVIHSYSKDLKQEWSHSDLVKNLLKLALAPVVDEFAKNKMNVLAGPLAPVIKGVVEELFRGIPLEISANSDYSITLPILKSEVFS